MIAAADTLSGLLQHSELKSMNGLQKDELQEHIESHLGEIPSGRRQCVTVAIESIQAAFADHRGRQVEEFRGERALICTCFGVSEDSVERVIASDEVVSVEDVTRICRAGAGCGSCRMIIADMLHDHELHKPAR